MGELDTTVDSFILSRYVSDVETSKVAQAVFGKYGLTTNNNKQL